MIPIPACAQMPKNMKNKARINWAIQTPMFLKVTSLFSFALECLASRQIPHHPTMIGRARCRKLEMRAYFFN
jgi:hypothetical protein